MTPAAPERAVSPDDRPIPRRVQLFVNPSAGSWRRQRVAALTRAFEAAGARVTLTTSACGALTVAANIDHVCAVGGDGTVRQVAAAVARAARPPSMSVYPLGTINLLARECGYPQDVDAFVRRAMRPAARDHYAALIDDIPMLACASVGPDSRAVAIVSPRLKRSIGRAAYLAAFAVVLIRWPRDRLRIVADAREIACAAVYVAKGRYFAGPWSLAPMAAVDEPLLHVVAIERGGRLAFLRFAAALLFGREPRAIRFTCTALTITGDTPAPVQADGDIVAHLPVRIVIAPETIAFA